MTSYKRTKTLRTLHCICNVVNVLSAIFFLHMLYYQIALSLRICPVIGIGITCRKNPIFSNKNHQISKYLPSKQNSKQLNQYIK